MGKAHRRVGRRRFAQAGGSGCEGPDQGWRELSWVRGQDGDLGTPSAHSWKSSENDLVVS